MYLDTKEQMTMNKRCICIYKRINELKEPIQKMPDDKFIQSMHELGWKLEIENLENELIDILFKACEIIGVEYISVNEMEILGDNTCDYNHPWSNIWTVSRIMDLHNSCGNKNQHQIPRNHLPKKLEGYKWDVKTRTVIGEAEKLITGRYNN